MIRSVDIPLAASHSARSIIRYLVAQLVESGHIAAERFESIVAALEKREELGSTNVGRGVAIPHVIDQNVSETIVMAARLSQPLRWDKADEMLVERVYLGLAPDRIGWQRALEQISVDLSMAR